MLCELSSIHLTIRELLGRKAKGTFATANAIMLFVTFTIFRICYFPIQINAHLQTAKFHDPLKKSAIYIFAWYSSPVIFSLVFLLNCYWYQFLLKGVVKMFCPKKDAKQ